MSFRLQIHIRYLFRISNVSDLKYYTNVMEHPIRTYFLLYIVTIIVLGNILDSDTFSRAQALRQ